MMASQPDKLLVLDWDGTLIYAAQSPHPDRPADLVGPYHVYVRRRTTATPLGWPSRCYNCPAVTSCVTASLNQGVNTSGAFWISR